MTTAVETFTITGTGYPWIKKDPNAILDYTFDWTDWLSPLGDSIASATPAIENTAEAGCTVQTHDVIAANKVRVWVSGGTLNQNAILRCRIQTTSGRTDDRSVVLRVRSR